VTFRGRSDFAAHAATLALLSLVLLFRALIPAGYMIAPSGGWAALTPCAVAATPAPGHHDGHPGPAKPAPPCAYAALASPALPPAPPPLAIPPAPPEPLPAPWSARTQPRPRPASPPPPSTGPPILA
jgi:hypothetical protein